MGWLKPAESLLEPNDEVPSESVPTKESIGDDVVAAAASSTSRLKLCLDEIRSVLSSHWINVDPLLAEDDGRDTVVAVECISADHVVSQEGIGSALQWEQGDVTDGVVEALVLKCTVLLVESLVELPVVRIVAVSSYV